MFLPSWVATKDSAAPEGGSEISIEKLETQLNTLKTMFAEKQKLVSDLEAYGPEGLSHCVNACFFKHFGESFFKNLQYQEQRHLQLLPRVERPLRSPRKERR